MTDPIPLRGVVVTYLKDQKGKPKRQGNRWWIRVWDERVGKYTSKTFEDKVEGIRWGNAELPKLQAGVKTSSSAKVEEVGKLYLEKLKAKGATLRHQQQFQQVIDGLIAARATDMKDPNFGDRVQRWLSTLKVQRNYERETRAASPSLKNKFLICARALAEYARKRGMLDAAMPDPLGYVDRWKQPKALKLTFTLTELRKLVADEHADDPWYLFACIAAYCGCRASEIRAMTWKMIDWEGGYLRIPADLPGNKTKTERRVPLMAELRGILEPRAKVGDVPILPPGVNSLDKDEAINDYAVTRAFQLYLGRCDIEVNHRGPHALRHTVAALLNAMGMSPFLAMGYLGHQSTTVHRDYAASASLYVKDVKEWGDQFYFRSEPAAKGRKAAGKRAK